MKVDIYRPKRERALSRWFDWDPFDEEFFTNPLRMLEPFGRLEGKWLPPVDVTEDAQAVHVKADLPGLQEKDIHLELNGGMLTISGEREEEKEEKDKRSHRRERVYGKFVRSFHVGEGVDVDRIEASYKNGTLNISLPKKSESKSRTINIRKG